MFIEILIVIDTEKKTWIKWCDVSFKVSQDTLKIPNVICPFEALALNISDLKRQ